jgi:hypothetical protein
VLARALREAAAAGVRVELIELGAWERRPLLAEYDPTTKTIAIDRSVVERLRIAHEADFADRFMAFAIWHELYHVRFSGRNERAAHAYAGMQTRLDATVFEKAARGLSR